jgi:hypothetical protein
VRMITVIAPLPINISVLSNKIIFLPQYYCHSWLLFGSFRIVISTTISAGLSLLSSNKQMECWEQWGLLVYLWSSFSARMGWCLAFYQTFFITVFHVFELISLLGAHAIAASWALLKLLLLCCTTVDSQLVKRRGRKLIRG